MSGDERALVELAAISDINVPHVILHYLYLPTDEAATSVATELRRHGFKTEKRIGADGVNWLVQACHEDIPSESLITSTRELMESLVYKSGGEYDGWEAEVQHPHGTVTS